MSQIPSNFGASATRSNSTGSTSDALSGLDMDEFLNLMITELQNQDPLDPTDNSEFLQQITQIREIGASDRLSSTLDSVLAGQNLSTASGLIGKDVKALSPDGEELEGTVERVTVAVDAETGERDLKVHVGDHQFGLNRIREIVSGDPENSTNNNQ